jgi:molybdate/tungstate transport system substrate-binding protein
MNKSGMVYFTAWLLLSAIFISSCRNNQSEKQSTDLSGELTIFHAGSLSVPFKALADSFCRIHPEVSILTESAGSLASIRKITDLNKPCDIMASADYTLIDKLLIPDYASWNLLFAGNEMSIVYHSDSRLADSLSADNWYKILLNPEVRFGRSDPDSDPCGYRAILTMKLTEKFLDQPGMTENFLQKDNKFIRPKEVDLLALLESGSIDYIFLYKSVAIQHKLKYLELSDSINLASPCLQDLYQTVSVEIAGNKPGDKITQHGEAMVYGLTILNNSKNKALAEAFISFILKDGLQIIENLGQTRVIPRLSEKSQAPAFLHEYLVP